MLGSLFSGIGGLELGLEAAGLGPVVWQVENHPFCQRVLAKHWPKADRSVGDVRNAGATTLAPVDIICGGFPCQDVSAAGRRVGLKGERSGLWYEYRRVVRELRPRIVVVENVASGAKAWLCPVRQSLHELGYDTAALAFGAEDVGAPHRRGRVFVVGFALADADGSGQSQPGRAVRDFGRRDRYRRESVADTDRAELWLEPRWRGWADGSGTPEPRRDGEKLADAQGARPPIGIGQIDTGHARSARRGEAMGDAHRVGWRPQGLPVGETSQFAEPSVSSGAMGDSTSIGRTEGRPESAWHEGRRSAVSASVGDAEPGVGGGVDGLPHWLERHQWPAGRGPAQHEGEPPRTVPPRSVKRRVARVKALGNAVVPQCALVVGRWIRSQM